MKSLEDIYGPFGQDVVRCVQRCMEREGSVASLLARFNLPAAATLNSQHEALRAFLYQYGVAFFLKVINSNMTPQEVEIAKGQLLLERAVGDLRSTHVHKAAPPASPHQPRPLAPPSNAPQDAPPGAPQAKEKQWIVTPSYVGPDRRSGKDRRRNPSDRRLRVELIFKNQRFGGRDRRKTKRRAEDRHKP